MLLTRMGHEVRTTLSGEEALAVAARFRPELVMCDIGMPGLDGASFANKVRGLKPRIKILATTGATDEQTIPGADRIIKKPFLPNDLLRAASELLHSERPHAL